MPRLDVPGGHSLWYERHGRGTRPAIWLHGGPGGGLQPGQAGLFDPDIYDIVLLDQRGAGRARPAAATDLAALKHNTTADLIADLEALRTALGFERWLIGGGSWGSCLAMAYAIAHPDRVTGLVLAGVATCTPADLGWLYGDMGAVFPEAHAAFRALAPRADTAALMAAYDAALRGPGAQDAADAWCTWEMAIFETHWSAQPGSRFADPAFRLGFARTCAHYFANGCFMEPDHIAANLARIAHIPARLIHARFDPSCPLRTPWHLAQNWPAASLDILPGRDHGALSDAMAPRIRAATDALARTEQPHPAHR